MLSILLLVFSRIPEQVQLNCVAQVTLCNQIFYDVVQSAETIHRFQCRDLIADGGLAKVLIVTEKQWSCALM